MLIYITFAGEHKMKGMVLMSELLSILFHVIQTHSEKTLKQLNRYFRVAFLVLFILAGILNIFS